ncbi:DUF6744 family protein [Paenibacillus xylanilyticus]|uniref:Uncharacterized protein n=1 Tax=Paenibacillus xylanilyticus TaxID=248903 RepID=A0A7Y6BVP7_9BACL|nr:DUF6744 family protein [Paenibacillus xylanilyticus]NUU75767.1 hypothetical protein [Paenibacillus xylanilyticus]
MRKMSLEMAQEITAVGMEDKDNVELMGYLVWYSIGLKLIDRNVLESHVRVSGIDEDLLPGQIRIPDAFRRSTKAIESKQAAEDGKRSERILVREIVNDSERIVRSIVREVIDPQQDEKLQYNTNEAVITFERDIRLLHSDIINPDIKPLVDRVQELFVQYQTTHDDSAVRHMCISSIKNMSPVMVKTSGGVYFIPIKHEETLRAFVRFVNLLECSSAYMIPLIKTKDTMDLVRTATVSQLNSALTNLRNAYENRESLTPSEISSIVNETNLSFDVIQDYQGLLTSDLQEMNSSITDMKRMLHAVSSLKSKRKPRSRGTRQLSLFD